MIQGLRIAVRADASPQMGLGHAIRCIALLQGFEQITTELQIDWYGHERSMIMPLFALIRSSIEFHDQQAPLPSAIPYDILISDVQAHRVDQIQQEQFQYRYHLAVDDLATDRGAVTGILNGTYRATGLLAFYEQMKAEQLFLGPTYYPLRSGFQALRQKAQRSKAMLPFCEKLNLLITIGGSDPKRYSERLVQLFSVQQTKWARIIESIILLIGPGVSTNRRLMLQGKITKQNRITLLRALPNPEQEMAKADLLLLSGGGALYEAACLGRPAIACIQTPAEQNNVRFFEVAELAEAGTTRGNHAIHMSLLWKQLNRFVQQPILLKRRSRLGVERIDGQGAVRVARQVVEVLLRGKDIESDEGVHQG